VRPALDVADIFRAHGSAYRLNQAGHLSLGQLKVMSAIEACRTAELGGHVERCEDCASVRISYNSCRNRHCPKCQGAAAQRWLEARQAELLPLAYYHVVFSLPAQIADIAFHNKAVVYDILFKAASETLLTIAADPKHLGARIGLTAVLHSWGSALTHHPHVHCIVPGGGLSPDGQRWISCRPRFFLPVRVLSRLFRRLFLDKLTAAHAERRLAFFGELIGLADRAAFAAHLAPLRRSEWVVYAKRSFAGPAPPTWPRPARCSTSRQRPWSSPAPRPTPSPRAPAPAAAAEWSSSRSSSADPRLGPRPRHQPSGSTAHEDRRRLQRCNRSPAPGHAPDATAAASSARPRPPNDIWTAFQRPRPRHDFHFSPSSASSISRQ